MSEIPYIDIVFDGPPGPQAGRFVEVEQPPGTSIAFGQWLQRPDGLWVLRFSDFLPELVQAKDDIEALQVELNGLRAWKRGVDEALNSGDGAYRP